MLSKMHETNKQLYLNCNVRGSVLTQSKDSRSESKAAFRTKLAEKLRFSFFNLSVKNAGGISLIKLIKF